MGGFSYRPISQGKPEVQSAVLAMTALRCPTSLEFINEAYLQHGSGIDSLIVINWDPKKSQWRLPNVFGEAITYQDTCPPRLELALLHHWWRRLYCRLITSHRREEPKILCVQSNMLGRVLASEFVADYEVCCELLGSVPDSIVQFARIFCSLICRTRFGWIIDGW